MSSIGSHDDLRHSIAGQRLVACKHDCMYCVVAYPVESHLVEDKSRLKGSIGHLV